MNTTLFQTISIYMCIDFSQVTNTYFISSLYFDINYKFQIETASFLEIRLQFIFSRLCDTSEIWKKNEHYIQYITTHHKHYHYIQTSTLNCLNDHHTMVKFFRFCQAQCTLNMCTTVYTFQHYDNIMII